MGEVCFRERRRPHICFISKDGDGPFLIPVGAARELNAGCDPPRDIVVDDGVWGDGEGLVQRQGLPCGEVATFQGEGVGDSVECAGAGFRGWNAAYAVGIKHCVFVAFDAQKIGADTVKCYFFWRMDREADLDLAAGRHPIRGHCKNRCAKCLLDKPLLDLMKRD